MLSSPLRIRSFLLHFIVFLLFLEELPLLTHVLGEKNESLYKYFTFLDQQVTFQGRFLFLEKPSVAGYDIDQPIALFDWSGDVITFQFTGTAASVTLDLQNINPSAIPVSSKRSSSYLKKIENVNDYYLIINGTTVGMFSTHPGRNRYVLVKTLPYGQHTIAIAKRTEALFGISIFYSFIVELPDEENDSGFTVSPLISVKDSKSDSIKLGYKRVELSRKLEVIGASVTCGYGVDGQAPCSFTPLTENFFHSFGFMLANEFQASYHTVCWSGKGVVRNSGDPNITSPYPMPVLYQRTIGSLPNSTWNFSSWIPDAVIINLGTNDFSSKPYPPKEIFVQGYVDFLKSIQSSYSDNLKLKIFVMCGPMSSGVVCDYIQEIASKVPNTFYVDTQNILDPSTDIGCDGHPNQIGQLKTANITIPIIRNLMNW